MSRRPIVAVIGDNVATDASAAIAEQVGRGIVALGYRLVTGGLGGIMEAASRGARSAPTHREGDVIGILPGNDASAANPYVDIVLPTHLGYARNVLVVSTADAVVAIGGGAGTLTEMAMAWQLGRAIIALDVPGWSQKLAGQAIDGKRPGHVFAAADPSEALLQLSRLLPQWPAPPASQS